MSERMISISRDFSPSPAGRYKSDGPFNGERFRQEILIPAIRGAVESREELTVDFSGADSYSSSFLEEAFGGLVRAEVVRPDELVKFLRLEPGNAIFASYVADASDYIQEEIKRRRR